MPFGGGRWHHLEKAVADTYHGTHIELEGGKLDELHFVFLGNELQQHNEAHPYAVPPVGLTNLYCFIK